VSRNIHPDLFDWAREREFLRTNRAARHLAQRYGLSNHLAITIAALAGLSENVMTR
jgi:hypothetical protein